MWTPEIVRARFHEAADTERYLPQPRMSNGAGYWPIHQYTEEDRDGWTAETKADAADRWARHRKLTRPAISRHEECLIWMNILPDEKQRRVIWVWAFSKAYERSFSAACKRRGWVPMTAWRRLHRVCEQIIDYNVGKGFLPRIPDEKYLLQNDPKYDNNSVGLEPVADTSQAVPFSHSYRTEPSRDTLDSPAALSAFINHLSAHNAQQRRLQRRAKMQRGVPGEQEAA